MFCEHASFFARCDDPMNVKSFLRHLWACLCAKKKVHVYKKPVYRYTIPYLPLARQQMNGLGLKTKNVQFAARSSH